MGDTALLALNKGEVSTAKSILEESIRTFEELKNPEWSSISTNRLTEVFCEQSEYENARKINQRNLEVQRETNNLEQIGWSIELKGRIELAEGNLSAARQMYNEALAIAEKRNHPYSMGFVKAALGLIDCYEGSFKRGREAIETGIEYVRRQHASDAAHLLVYRSRALWLEKDLPSAARSYRDTIKELHVNFYYIHIAECLEGLGKIAVTQNDFERAARLFGAAEGMREKMGTPVAPLQRGEYEDKVSELRAGIGDEKFKRIWEKGRAMSRDEAVQYALVAD